MSPYQIVGMALRQAVLQHLEAATAVTGARDNDFAIDRDAPLVLDRRDKPGGVWVAWMGGDRKAEFRRADRRQLVPVGTGIFRTEDAIVVLAPNDFRMRGTARKQVNVLDDRVLALLRRHVFVVHALVDDLPGGAGIGARPEACARHADANVRGIARIDKHGVDPRLLATRDT